MVKTSIGMGLLPDLHGVRLVITLMLDHRLIARTRQTVSWIPADAVASTYLDLIVFKDRLPYVLHLTHPRSVKWRQAIQNIKTFLEGHTLSIVPFSEWLAQLEQQPMNGKTFDDFVSKHALMNYNPSLMTF